MNRWLTLATLTTLALSAPAQAAPPNPLDRLIGTWKATGTAALGPASAAVAATWKCAKVSAGSGVSCKLRVTGIPDLVLEETDLFGVDAGTGKLRWFAVTNIGEVHDHTAPVADDTWQFGYDGVVEGKPMHEAITLTWSHDRRSFTLSAKVTIGGAVASGFELSAKKAGGR